MKKVMCIYHGGCPDGFGAAWAVREGAKAHGLLDTLEFHPGKYNELPPDVTGKYVVMVDFSYKRDVLLEMADQAVSIEIYDHHKSAMSELVNLPGNVRPVFDMNRSGAMITWNEVFPDTPAPTLLYHIQDRDLWKFALDNTREIMATVFSHPYDFDAWTSLMGTHPDDLIVEGEALLRAHSKNVAELIDAGETWMEIGGYRVPALNCPYMFGSDACHILAKGQPFAAYYWIDKNSAYNFGLRSAPDGLDVSKIAQRYGGGGHEHAAGFVLDSLEEV